MAHPGSWVDSRRNKGATRRSGLRYNGQIIRKCGPRLGRFLMRLLISVLFTCLCFCPSFARPSQQDGQVAEPTASALTNKDVLEMLGAGLTAEVVIAKVKLSKCDF